MIMGKIILQEIIEELKYDWIKISIDPRVTFDMVLNNPKAEWIYFSLSENINISMDIVKKNPDKAWHAHGLSRNPGFTLQTVLDNPHICWRVNELYRNPGMDINALLKIRGVNMNFICDHPMLTFEILQKIWIQKLKNINREFEYNPKLHEIERIKTVHKKNINDNKKDCRLIQIRNYTRKILDNLFPLFANNANTIIMKFLFTKFIPYKI